jgi:hypothetical protein
MLFLRVTPQLPSIQLKHNFHALYYRIPEYLYWRQKTLQPLGLLGKTAKDSSASRVECGRLQCLNWQQVSRYCQAAGDNGDHKSGTEEVRNILHPTVFIPQLLLCEVGRSFSSVQHANISPYIPIVIAKYVRVNYSFQRTTYWKFEVHFVHES